MWEEKKKKKNQRKEVEAAKEGRRIEELSHWPPLPSSFYIHFKVHDKVEVSAQVKAITGCLTKSRLTLDRSRVSCQSTLNRVSIGQE